MNNQVKVGNEDHKFSSRNKRIKTEIHRKNNQAVLDEIELFKEMEER